jgi:hypothetical protein
MREVRIVAGDAFCALLKGAGEFSMTSLMSAILSAGLTAIAAAQVVGVSLPVRIGRAYEVIGFDGVKPHSRGTLTLSPELCAELLMA